MRKALQIALYYVIFPAILIMAATLAWLQRDAHRPLDAYFADRHGELVDVSVTEASHSGDQDSQFLTLRSDSGLHVSMRAIFRPDATIPLPVLIVLGGHRTGSDAVDLFGSVGEKAVVALDYPYDGPEKAKGLFEVARTIPLARKAFIDTPPAVSLAVDWVVEQDWADINQIVVVGASLGVPFAALAAARDHRISAAMLVHGAADNQVWLEAQVARRVNSRFLHRPLATLVHWLAYGPTFNTAENITRIAPRPVVIIGARADERTPVGQTEALYAAAGEPKQLRWTEGLHIEPGRADIIAELLAIADELLPFQTDN